MTPETRATETDPLDAKPLANVLWLVDPPAWREALVVGQEDGPLSRAMSVRFANVQVAEWPDPADTKSFGASERFDLVAIDALDAERTQVFTGHDVSRTWRDLLMDARRVLRVGGVLLIPGSNPRWFRTRLQDSRSPTTGRRGVHGAAIEGLNAMSFREVLALLRDCGFSRPFAFFADPSGYAPQYLLPASRRAVSINERLTSRHSLTIRLRQLAGAIGLHEMLYPGRLFIASR